MLELQRRRSHCIMLAGTTCRSCDSSERAQPCACACLAGACTGALCRSANTGGRSHPSCHPAGAGFGPHRAAAGGFGARARTCSADQRSYRSGPCASGSGGCRTNTNTGARACACGWCSRRHK